MEASREFAPQSLFYTSWTRRQRARSGPGPRAAHPAARHSHADVEVPLLQEDRFRQLLLQRLVRAHELQGEPRARSATAPARPGRIPHIAADSRAPHGGGHGTGGAPSGAGLRSGAATGPTKRTTELSFGSLSKGRSTAIPAGDAPPARRPAGIQTAAALRLALTSRRGLRGGA